MKRSRRPAVLRVRCTAMSKQAGRRCRRWATPGGTVCYWHGGSAPAVISKAEIRQAVELVKNGNGEMPVQQVLHDAVMIADLALQDLLNELPPTLSPEDYEHLLVAASRAGLLARAAAADGGGMLSVRAGQLRQWSEERLKAWERRRAMDRAAAEVTAPEPVGGSHGGALPRPGPAFGLVPNWGSARRSPLSTRVVP